ncbi:MAG TPA: HAMP domain-containing sensor histidine kinase [Burkholderiales bacterium]|nr:HAMP domain-containing sensor histidine kinase [Burkholderiales bacterium]
MQLRYPKSFLKLLFVGFALVTLPLMFALINNAVSIDRLADQSRHAVYEAVQATESGRALAELITAEERVARQYLVLADPELLTGLVAAHERLLRAARSLGGMPLSDAQRRQLNDIVAREAAVFEGITDDPLTPGKAAPLHRADALAAEFRELAQMAGAMLARSNEVIAHEVDSLQALAGKARQIVIWQMLALLPAAIVLVVGFALVLARPIRQIDAGIRKLGTGDFTEPITVSGPQDLEYLGRQLEWLRNRLAELEEQKSRFMRHVSHELKTPLTALREGSELLADESAGPLTSEQREVVRILRDNSIELRKLIENLLNYSAARHQRDALEARPVRMREVIGRVAADQKLAMLAKDLSFKVHCPDFTLHADEDKLRVALDNLVSNAVKYSPRGGAVLVSARERAGEVVLEVVDQGPGVERKDRGRIFEPFFQGRRPAVAPVGGTGLGLAIAREHVLSHGGNIELVDDARGGAHFKVTLPALPARDAA